MPGPPRFFGPGLAEAVRRGEVGEAVLDAKARRVALLGGARRGAAAEARGRRASPSARQSARRAGSREALAPLRRAGRRAGSPRRRRVVRAARQRRDPAARAGRLRKRGGHRTQRGEALHPGRRRRPHRRPAGGHPARRARGPRFRAWRSSTSRAASIDLFLPPLSRDGRADLDGQPGLTVEFFRGQEPAGEPVASWHVDSSELHMFGDLPAGASRRTTSPCGCRAGSRRRRAARIEIAMRGFGGRRLLVDGVVAADVWDAPPAADIPTALFEGSRDGGTFELRGRQAGPDRGRASFGDARPVPADHRLPLPTGNRSAGPGRRRGRLGRRGGRRRRQRRCLGYRGPRPQDRHPARPPERAGRAGRRGQPEDDRRRQRRLPDGSALGGSGGRRPLRVASGPGVRQRPRRRPAGQRRSRAAACPSRSRLASRTTRRSAPRRARRSSWSTPRASTSAIATSTPRGSSRASASGTASATPASSSSRWRSRPTACPRATRPELKVRLRNVGYRARQGSRPGLRRRPGVVGPAPAARAEGLRRRAPGARTKASTSPLPSRIATWPTGTKPAAAGGSSPAGSRSRSAAPRATSACGRRSSCVAVERRPGRAAMRGRARRRDRAPSGSARPLGDHLVTSTDPRPL